MMTEEELHLRAAGPQLGNFYSFELQEMHCMAKEASRVQILQRTLETQLASVSAAFLSFFQS